MYQVYNDRYIKINRYRRLSSRVVAPPLTKPDVYLSIHLSISGTYLVMQTPRMGGVSDNISGIKTYYVVNKDWCVKVCKFSVSFY